MTTIQSSSYLTIIVKRLKAINYIYNKMSRKLQFFALSKILKFAVGHKQIICLNRYFVERCLRNTVTSLTLRNLAKPDCIFLSVAIVYSIVEVLSRTKSFQLAKLSALIYLHASGIKFPVNH